VWILRIYLRNVVAMTTRNKAHRYTKATFRIIFHWKYAWFSEWNPKAGSILSLPTCYEGARGSIVGWGTMLQAGRSPVRVADELEFFNYLILPAAQWPWGRLNLWVKSGRHVGLTTLPTSVSRMSENVGASTSCNPKGLHGLYRDNFTFTFYVT
jgi:hypothetical protein